MVRWMEMVQPEQVKVPRPMNETASGVEWANSGINTGIRDTIEGHFMCVVEG